MTKTELQEKIAHLESELTEVKEQVSALWLSTGIPADRVVGGVFKPEKKQAAALPEKVDGVFNPEYGQEFWYISTQGTTFVDNWGGDSIECAQYAIGNCFPTEQAAEDAVRVLKLIRKARESQDGFVPDWENLVQNKYFLCLDRGLICVASHLSWNQAPILGFWKDELACYKFVHKNREELLWFFTEYRL